MLRRWDLSRSACLRVCLLVRGHAESQHLAEVVRKSRRSRTKLFRRSSAPADYFNDVGAGLKKPIHPGDPPYSNGPMYRHGAPTSHIAKPRRRRGLTFNLPLAAGSTSVTFILLLLSSDGSDTSVLAMALRPPLRSEVLENQQKLTCSQVRGLRVTSSSNAFPPPPRLGCRLQLESVRALPCGEVEGRCSSRPSPCPFPAMRPS